MSCNNLGDIKPCGTEKNLMLNIKNAGINVGIDLEKPIDCSQMTVREVSTLPVQEYVNMHFERTAVLQAYVFNEEGEREELTITFVLKSIRIPKLKKDREE